MNVPVPEFSRVISVSRIPPKDIEERLEAKPAERAALAKRFDLIELSTLNALITLTKGPNETVAAKGTIKADLSQQCVVTLEPIHTHFDLDVDMTFLPAEQNKDGAGSPEQDALEEEFELFSDGKIDIGEMVAQQLGVSIDPYPRKANAKLVVTEFGAKVEEPHPFAKLSTVIKTKKNNKIIKD